MPKWVRSIIIIIICLAAITIALVTVAERFHTLKLETHIQLPLLAFFGVVALITILSCVAIGFSAVDLSDRSQALGLPNGSIRAVIALSLILLFGIVAVFLYATLLETDVPSAQDFAKQLLVLLGTLITSIASFYFGTQAATNAQQPITGAPTLTRVDPASRAVGTTGEVCAYGTNLQLATSLKLVSGAQELVGSGVTSDASVVKGTIEIPTDAPPGKWDVVVDTSDGKTTKLAAAFTVTQATSGGNGNAAGGGGAQPPTPPDNGG
jgi:hypothetical protein